MKAWELLDSPKKWTQGTEARTVNKCSCYAGGMEATQWCLLGALVKCYGEVEYHHKRDIVAKAINTSPTAWNDAVERTWEEVHQLLKELDL